MNRYSQYQGIVLWTTSGFDIHLLPLTCVIHHWRMILWIVMINIKCRSICASRHVSQPHGVKCRSKKLVQPNVSDLKRELLLRQWSKLCKSSYNTIRKPFVQLLHDWEDAVIISIPENTIKNQSNIWWILTTVPLKCIIHHWRMILWIIIVKLKPRSHFSEELEHFV